ncbi:MAG: hypothetical protein C4K58_06770 [Flavobacteriaceae bacterium]|nr:MAG: hypothetical protein C4K58_06770 [Flavobacteriaceae bacterium]
MFQPEMLPSSDVPRQMLRVSKKKKPKKKHTTININIQKLVDRIVIVGKVEDEQMDEVKQRLEDALLRVLESVEDLKN